MSPRKRADRVFQVNERQRPRLLLMDDSHRSNREFHSTDLRAFFNTFKKAKISPPVNRYRLTLLVSRHSKASLLQPHGTAQTKLRNRAHEKHKFLPFSVLDRSMARIPDVLPERE